MMWSNTIFKKDFMLLKNHLLGALVVQAVLGWTVPILHSLIIRSRLIDIPALELDAWFPQLQIAVNIIVALIASVYLLNEERSDKTLSFLQRLPVHPVRLWTEKFLSGLAIIALVILIQYLWFLMSSLLGFHLWDRTEPVMNYLIALSFFAYAVGIFLSFFIRQSIVIILSGIVVIMILYWMGLNILSIFTTEFRHTARFLFQWFLREYSVYVIVLIVAFFWIRYQRQFYPTPKLNSLSRKQFQELQIPYIVSFLLVFVSLVFCYALEPNLIWSMNSKHSFEFNYDVKIVIVVVLTCLLFTIYLGIITYQVQEKQAKTCCLYYQPVSRTTIFCVKSISTLIPTLLIAVSIALLLAKLGYNSINHFTAHEIAWESSKFLFLNWLFLAFLPYGIALLCTHSIQNQIHAYFVSLLGFIILMIVFLFQYNPILFVHGVYTNDFSFRLVELLDKTDPSFQWPLFLTFAIFLVSGWLASIEVNVLSGKTPYRMVYTGFLFIVGVGFFLG